MSKPDLWAAGALIALGFSGLFLAFASGLPTMEGWAGKEGWAGMEGWVGRAPRTNLADPEYLDQTHVSHPSEALPTGALLGFPPQNRDRVPEPQAQRVAETPLFFSVQFPAGSIRPVLKKGWLEQAKAWAENCPDGQFLVEGHSDNRGKTEDNLKLSWRRARAVARVLRRAGFVEDRLLLRAYGAYKPILDAPPTHELQRRVEVSFRCEEVS